MFHLKEGIETSSEQKKKPEKTTVECHAKQRKRAKNTAHRRTSISR